jgi:hypothetical protein
MPAAALQEAKASALETLQRLAFPQPDENTAQTKQRQLLYTNGIITLVQLAQRNPSLGSIDELLTILQAHAFSHDLGITGLEPLILYLMNSQINHEKWEELEHLWDTCDPSKTADAGAWVPQCTNGTHCLLFAKTVLTLKNGGAHRADISPGLPVLTTLADATVTLTYSPPAGAEQLALTLEHAPLMYTLDPRFWTVAVSPSHWSDATWIKSLKLTAATAAFIGAFVALTPATPVVAVLLTGVGITSNLVASEWDFLDSVYKDAQTLPLPNAEPPEGDITVSMEPDTGGGSGSDGKGKLAFDETTEVFE